MRDQPLAAAESVSIFMEYVRNCRRMPCGGPGTARSRALPVRKSPPDVNSALGGRSDEEVTIFDSPGGESGGYADMPAVHKQYRDLPYRFKVARYLC